MGLGWHGCGCTQEVVESEGQEKGEDKRITRIFECYSYDFGMMVTPYPKLREVKHHESDQGYGWVTNGGTGPLILITI